MTEMPSSSIISTKLQRIAKLANEAPQLAFTSLAHHMDEDFLHEAHRRTRKGAAVGVDGQTAVEYAANLKENLQLLLGRAKSGTYRAPPVRRVHIPKGDGSKTRPIGVPTFEDKVLQRAVVMLLEPIYEQDFVDWSYGFRPGRSAHQALTAVREGLWQMRGGWVLEVDIASFFDELAHECLRGFVRKRVRDGVLLRLLGKWLNAGVCENGVVMTSDEGTPQGGVVSPLLANIYLHEVFDRWFEDEVQPRMQGHAFAVRYADDILIAFTSELDAQRVMEVLPKRFDRFGLRLHPEKTRLVKFHRPPWSGRGPKAGTFDLLGFTHFWGRSRAGNWVIRRKTASDRFRRAVGKVARWCQFNRHLPVRLQHERLCAKLRGLAAYYGIAGNSRSLWQMRTAVMRAWRRWLHRRSQRGLTWTSFYKLLQRFPLPKPKIVRQI
jgi:group II intron reverse transcriptase/maturase